MTGVTIAYIGTVPTKSPSHWAESGTMVWQNCNENDGKEDALVYMRALCIQETGQVGAARIN